MRETIYRIKWDGEPFEPTDYTQAEMEHANQDAPEVLEWLRKRHTFGERATFGGGASSLCTIVAFPSGGEEVRP